MVEAEEQVPELGSYAVVIRASSRIVIDIGERIGMRMRSAGREVTLSMFSLHTDEGHEARVPRELIVEAVGQAPSLNEAVSSFYDLARPMGPILAFCGNAAVGLLEPHLAWDSTDGRAEREFMEVYLKDERGLPLPGRRLKLPETRAFLNLLSDLPDDQLGPLVGIISRYGVALDNWYLGGETAALPYLWFAAEAFAKLIVHAELSNGRSFEDVADAHGMPRSGGVSRRQLEAFMRWKVGFDGDRQLHDRVKSVSDDLEHGSIPLHEAHPKTADLTPGLFGALRASILKFVDPATGPTAGLNEGATALPLDTIQRRVVRGRFLDVGDELAHQDQLYPVLEWRTVVDTISRDERGDYNMTYSDKLTVRCAPGVAFRAESFEVRGRPDGSSGRPPTVANVQSDDQPDETQRDRVMPLMKLIAEAFRALGPGATGAEFTQARAHLLELHNLSKGLFLACYKLIAAGLPEEALIVGRSLFRQAMWFLQLSKADADEQAALALGWRLQSLRDSLELLHMSDDSSPEVAAAAEARMQKIVESAHRLGIDELKDFRNVHETAAQLEDPDYAQIHALAGAINSGSDIAGTARRVLHDGHLALHDTSPDSWLYPATAKYVVGSSLIAMKGACAVFGWEDDRGALAAAEAEFERLNSTDEDIRPA